MLPIISINHAPIQHDRAIKGIVLLALGIVASLGLFAWLQQLNTEQQRLNADLQHMQAPIAMPKLNGKESQAKQPPRP